MEDDLAGTSGRRVDRSRASLGAAAHNVYSRACGSHCLRGGQADAACASGHEGELVLQVSWTERRTQAKRAQCRVPHVKHVLQRRHA